MTIQVDQYNINYKITGEGEETVVVLQGWGTSLSAYDSIAQILGSSYKVVQFDFPGFGKSDEPREAWDVSRFAKFFCDFMEELNIKKATLVGHSYGGRVIIKLANMSEKPFEIDKVILIDSAGVLPIRTLKQQLRIKNYKLWKKIYANKIVQSLFPEVVEDWKSRQGSADYRNASLIMRQCLVLAVNEDLTEELSAITQETLLIWGDCDTATPMRDANIMKERIQNAGLVVLQGAGHFSFVEQPEKFCRIMRSFMGMENK